MMRYQRVSPDCLGLPSGRKPSFRTCKDDDADTAGRISSYPTFDAKPPRVRSGSGSASGTTNPSHTQDNNNHHFPHLSGTSDPLPPENPKPQNNHDVNGRCSPGDALLQWGHNKRSRGSRAEPRTVGDESSGHSRQHIKIQRRAAIAGAEKIAAASAASAMPPPLGGGYTRGANLRPCMPLRDSTGTHHNRIVEERSGGHSRLEKRSPPSPPEKPTAHKMAATTAASNNGFGPDPSSPMNHHHHQEPKNPSDQDTVGSGSGGAAAAGAPEKVNLEQFEWPRIYLSLSRKEKEDDFLAMKGTKLPQRPKKRAKNVDKTLQYCFPGMWLSDLTRGRYEVREKKCVKKKRRGLKGMESMDSDSE